MNGFNTSSPTISGLNIVQFNSVSLDPAIRIWPSVARRITAQSGSTTTSAGIKRKAAMAVRL